MAWTRKFGNQLYDILYDKECIDRILNDPITPAMCSTPDNNLLTIFGERILLWPTFDIRFNGFQCGTKIMEDIARGMETNITRKDLKNNIIELSVDVITNLGEIEKYNLLVEQHNKEWVANGRNTHIVDPVHGDVIEIKDQLVDPVLISSRNNPAPDCKINDTTQTGPLSRARPTIKRKTYAKVI